MKTLTSLIVAVAAFGSLVANQAQAFIDPGVDILVKPSGALKDQILTKDGKSKFDLQDNSKINRGGLAIKSFKASRDESRKINIVGSVVFDTIFTKAKPVSFTYTISKMSKMNWVTIDVGSTQFIGPNATKSIVATLPATNESVRLMLTVKGGPNGLVSRQFTVPPRKPSWVVTYTTSLNWINARYWDNDLSDGFDASQLVRNEFAPLGIQTRITKRKATGVDSIFSISTKIHTTLTIRTTGKLNRTFDLKTDAIKFRNHLIALVPDKGLTVEDVRED